MVPDSLGARTAPLRGNSYQKARTPPKHPQELPARSAEPGGVQAANSTPRSRTGRRSQLFPPGSQSSAARLSRSPLAARGERGTPPPPPRHLPGSRPGSSAGGWRGRPGCCAGRPHPRARRGAGVGHRHCHDTGRGSGAVRDPGRWLPPRQPRDRACWRDKPGTGGHPSGTAGHRTAAAAPPAPGTHAPPGKTGFCHRQPGPADSTPPRPGRRLPGGNDDDDRAVSGGGGRSGVTAPGPRAGPPQAPAGGAGPGAAGSGGTDGPGRRAERAGGVAPAGEATPVRPPPPQNPTPPGHPPRTAPGGTYRAQRRGCRGRAGRAPAAAAWPGRGGGTGRDGAGTLRRPVACEAAAGPAAL